MRVETRDRPATIRKPDSLSRVDTEDRPTKRVVVTGIAMRTPLGNLEQTMEARFRGDSAVQVFPDTGVDDIYVAAPLTYNPMDNLDLGKQAKWYSPLAALELDVLIDAFSSAGMLGSNGRIDSRFNAYKGGLYGYSGIGQALGLVEMNEIIARNRELKRLLALGMVGPKEAQREVVKISHSFKAFPDQGNSRASEYLGLKGRGNYASQACASGLAAISDAYESIKSGKNRWAAAGGAEKPLTQHELAFTTFDVIHAISHNPDPNTASRPLDKDRDGFVLGEGAAYLIMESEEHAKARGAHILAEITGAENAMDGYKETVSDPFRVALNISKAVETEEGDLTLPKVVYLHATSTPPGDLQEIEALRIVYEGSTEGIALVANKSAFGHTLGAAGAITAVEAVYAISTGRIAPTIHLKSFDPELGILDVVTQERQSDPDTALVLANGFGGWDSALALKKPQTE